MKQLRIIMTARYLPPEYSGTAAQAFLLAERLRQRGHCIEFVTQSWEGDHREYEIDGFKVTALKTNLQTRHGELGLWRNLFGYLLKRRDGFDILHAHGAYYTQAIVGPFARLLGKRSLVKVSLADNDLKSLTGSGIARLHRFFLDQVDAYVAISAEIQKEFTRRGLRPERIVSIPNGVDLERFRPADAAEKRALAQSMGVPEDRPIGLFVGVFDERKKVAWLMEQWVRNQAFGTGARLLAIGPTSRDHYGPELRQHLEDLGSKHPNLVGTRGLTQEIERYYRLADFFILPSSNEGLPNAMLEAMACGLPCVASRVSGSSDLIRDGETGATFRVEDTNGLAAAVVRVQGEGGRRMGAAARRHVEKGYDIRQITKLYEALYLRLTSRGEDTSARGKREPDFQ